MALKLRIKELRDGKGLTLEQLAEIVGVDVSYLSRMESGKRRINSKWLEKIADALKVLPVELLGNGSSRLMNPSPDGVTHTASIKVVGAVEAGQWKEQMEWSREQWFDLAVPPPPKAEKPFALLVKGPSMNKVFADGAYVVCVRLGDFWRTPQTGDHIIVERHGKDGLIEATVKELVFDDDGRAWLWPRSSHPKHQEPLEVPWPPPPEGEDGDCEICIVAVVVGFYQTLIR